MYRTILGDKLGSLIIGQGRLVTVSKGEVIVSSEEYKTLQLVKDGYIKRYQITNSGGISIQSIFGPNDVFSLTYIYQLLFHKNIYTGPETYYYEAMDKASFYSIDGSILKQAVANDPLLYKDLLGVAGDRLNSSIQLLENISLSVFYKRVAHQLWYYANKFSDRQGNVAKLKIPLTQQDLADVLSTTRETVSLCMSELKKKGLIKPGKYLTISDVDGLKAEAFN